MIRQQILYLWLAGSSLDDAAIGWAFHDGADGEGPPLPDTEPPYATGVHALRDGWMLLQSSPLVSPAPGEPHTNSFFEYEFVFERRTGGTDGPH